MAAQFDFLKDHDGTLYKHLSDVEKSARLRLNNCANDLRCALERLADVLIQENIPKPSVLERLYREQNSRGGWDLNAKLKALQDEALLKKAGCEKKEVLPSKLGKISLLFKDGQYKSFPAYTAIRKFGNMGSHPENEIKNNDEPALTFRNLVACLGALHRLLKFLYCENSVPGFDENLMNIESYTVDEKPVTPPDGHRSKCQLEFRGSKREGVTGTVRYAILRQYARGDVSEKLLKRNIDFQQTALASNPYGAKGIIQDVRKIDDGMSDFTIIVYEFPRRPENLRDVLSLLSKEERLRLCRDLADCFKDLHGSAPALYHRMLTHESIYLCNFGSNEAKRWLPYIKFDFGKISVSSDEMTVMHEASRAKGQIKEREVEKYVLQSAWNQEHWERADRYSLGVLFGDILCGKIRPKPADDEDIEDAGFPDEVGALVEDLKIGKASAADAFQTLNEVC